jgi:hypothetical protein
METFTEPKELLKNPHFPAQRRKGLAGLSDEMLDVPIIELIKGFNKIPYCFTIQSCYGHFVYTGQTDPRNLEPLPLQHVTGNLEYRIAYICLGIENSARGRNLLAALKEIPLIDPQNIQFGCAEWFWKRQVNSYALQVQPDRFKQKDSAILEYEEALQIQKIRNAFFVQLRELLRKQPGHDPHCSDTNKAE